MEYSKKEMSISEMKEVIESFGKPYRNFKKLDHNTFCCEWDTPWKAQSFFLYKTQIVSFVRNLIAFNVQGLRTQTTKNRLNDILHQYGFSIFSKGVRSSKWLISDRDRKAIAFKDDMVIANNEQFSKTMVKFIERS